MDGALGRRWSLAATRGALVMDLDGLAAACRSTQERGRRGAAGRLQRKHLLIGTQETNE
jgi:hypothetical protein